MGRPANSPAPDFGAKLASARLAAGMTQADLANALGISQQMVDYYERRAKNPTAAFIQKAARALEVSVEDLLPSSKPPKKRKPGPDSEIEKRLRAIKQLPRERQKLVLQFLDSFLRDSKSQNR